MRPQAALIDYGQGRYLKALQKARRDVVSSVRQDQNQGERGTAAHRPIPSLPYYCFFFVCVRMCVGVGVCMCVCVCVCMGSCYMSSALYWA